MRFEAGPAYLEVEFGPFAKRLGRSRVDKNAAPAVATPATQRLVFTVSAQGEVTKRFAA